MAHGDRRETRSVIEASCHCGVVRLELPHWEPMRRTSASRIGVNMRNVDPALIAKVRVRRFDGAKTWKFLD